MQKALAEAGLTGEYEGGPTMAREASDRQARNELIDQIIAAGEIKGGDYNAFATALARDLEGPEGVALSDSLGLSEPPGRYVVGDGYKANSATDMVQLRSNQTWSQQDLDRYEASAERLHFGFDGGVGTGSSRDWEIIRRLEAKYGVKSLTYSPLPWELQEEREAREKEDE